MTDIDDDALARKLGLLEGDIIVGMNGTAVEDSSDLARMLLRWRSMQGTTLVVWRGRHYVSLKAPRATEARQP